MLILFFVLNLVISFLNAWGAGRTWNLTKQVSTIAYILNWCAAIMSACGFTWCYSIILVFGGLSFGYLSPEQAQLAFELGYVIIAPAIVGTGLIITVNSWVEFIKKPSLGGGMTTAWNTYAQYRNTVDLINFFPDFLGDVFAGSTRSKESDDDSSSKLTLMVVLTVVLALLAGILTTRYIILRTANAVRY